MKFRTVYCFSVIDEIKEGKTVYCLDRKAREVHCVNELTVNDTVAMLNAEGTEPNRFEYWIETREDSPVVFKKIEKFGEDLFPRYKDDSVKEDTNNA